MMLQAALTCSEQMRNVCVQKYKRIGNSANALHINCRHLYFTDVCTYTEYL